METIDGSFGVTSRSYLLVGDVIFNPVLKTLAYSLRRDGVEVGGGEDLVDDGAIRSALLGRN